MATITLSTDTLISTLMPSGGGTLASGDTIQLAGHSLIVDADAVDYPVTIANSGGDANLELRDLGRIKLNATLPATVHPWVDPEHPLPVSAEPGIDGDTYRTPLTANARAEIQLAGNFSLGGGAASLPTATREGGFYGLVASTSSGTITLDRSVNLHAGDFLVHLSHHAYVGCSTVSEYNSTSNLVSFNSSPSRLANGDLWGVIGGGVVINLLASNKNYTRTIGAPIIGGTINIVALDCAIIGAAICAESFSLANKTIVDMYNFPFAGFVFDGTLKTSRLVASYLFPGSTNNENAGIANLPSNYIDAEEVALWWFLWAPDGNVLSSPVRIRGGIIGRRPLNNDWPCFSPRTADSSVLAFSAYGTSFISAITYFRGPYRLKNCNVAGNVVSAQIESAGIVSDSPDGFYHAPATATNVTWRYTERTVAPGATLRLRCAWQREGSAATRASVAVTDPATWWPQLWPLGADALASVEFTGGTADWRQELLTWRNTGTEAVTVRVWECVTGMVSGGYLKVEEVKGGQL